MYEVRSDTSRNCLVLTLRGYMREDEAAEATDRVIRESNSLKRGFTIINDISDFKPMSQSAAEHIKRAQNHVSTLGVGLTIRVVRSAATEMQFKRTYHEAKGDYEVVCVRTMDEALRYLEEYESNRQSG